MLRRRSHGVSGHDALDTFCLSPSGSCEVLSKDIKPLGFKLNSWNTYCVLSSSSHLLEYSGPSQINSVLVLVPAYDEFPRILIPTPTSRKLHLLLELFRVIHGEN